MFYLGRAVNGGIGSSPDGNSKAVRTRGEMSAAWKKRERSVVVFAALLICCE